MLCLQDVADLVWSWQLCLFLLAGSMHVKLWALRWYLALLLRQDGSWPASEAAASTSDGDIAPGDAEENREIALAMKASLQHATDVQASSSLTAPNPPIDSELVSTLARSPLDLPQTSQSGPAPTAASQTLSSCKFLCSKKLKGCDLARHVRHQTPQGRSTQQPCLCPQPRQTQVIIYFTTLTGFLTVVAVLPAWRLCSSLESCH